MWSPLLNQVTDILTLSREIDPADAERKSLRYDDYLSFEMQLYFSQKQLPGKMKSRLVILECAGYIFWPLFLQRLYYAYMYLRQRLEYVDKNRHP